MPYKCFLVESTGIHILEASFDWLGCTKTPFKDGKHHTAREVVRGTEAEVEQAPAAQRYESFEGPCEWCGVASPCMSPSVIGTGGLWRRADTGEVKRRIHDFGVGAMYEATWFSLGDPRPGEVVRFGYDWDNAYDAPLHVITPGGEWNIDSRASNCTLKNDRLHRCWIRHGTPPNITVDKAGGRTCAAGAGSIQAGSYHGFLRNGSLT